MGAGERREAVVETNTTMEPLQSLRKWHIGY